MKKKDPYAALRFAEFRYFISVQFLFTIAILMQEVVIGYEIYEITHDPLSLGFVGLAEAIPYISLVLFGGYFADKKDKKKIISICYIIVIISTLILIYATNSEAKQYFSQSDSLQNQQLLLIYFALFLIGVARGFYGPSWSSLKPFLVPSEHYANSSAWSTQFWQAGAILGPVAGGFLYSFIGLTNTLWLALGIFIAASILFFQIKSKPVAAQNEVKGIFESLREGISFVWNQKIIFYAILLDMFSVLFGGVMAILPVFAKDILHVGAEGFGIMRAAPGLGAVLMMFASAYFTPTNQPWRNMLIAVAGFGLATLAFAISTNFIFSLVMLFLTGAFDSISVIVRQTILQIMPPENMRGRVNSVSGVFVSCSNELGAFESGVAAKLFGTVPSVVFGGIMTLVTVSVIYFKSPELFAVKLQKQIE
jgi:MFS family permease